MTDPNSLNLAAGAAQTASKAMDVFQNSLHKGADAATRAQASLNQYATATLNVSHLSQKASQITQNLMNKGIKAVQSHVQAEGDILRKAGQQKLREVEQIGQKVVHTQQARMKKEINDLKTHPRAEESTVRKAAENKLHAVENAGKKVVQKEHALMDKKIHDVKSHVKAEESMIRKAVTEKAHLVEDTEKKILKNTHAVLNKGRNEVHAYLNEGRKDYHKAEAEKTRIVNDANKARTKINQEHQKIDAAITKFTSIANVKTLQDGVKSVQDILGSSLVQRKAAAVEHKVMAEKENVISTYKNATEAFGAMAGIPFAGPVLGAAAAAGAVAAGLANGIQIASSGFANGTPSAPPGMAWVGERGPELVDFQGGERVYNNNESNNMVNQGAQTTNMSFHYSPTITSGGGSSLQNMMASYKECWGRFIDKQLIAKGYAKGK